MEKHILNTNFGRVEIPWLKALIKRVVDIVVSAFALLALIPLFGLIAVAIKRDSKGPVFYRGDRVGKLGKRFTILKFRTMYENPESYRGPKITAQGDPRITPIGKWLRDTKLNELPQFWNVLKGQMSLVGPRAERPELVEHFQKHVPFYRARLLVKPGITGWAQINFGYAASIDETRIKLEYDLYYIKHRNLWMDLMTLIRTPGTMFGMQGQ